MNTTQSNNPVVIRLALLIIPLALIAATAGVFWQGSGAPYPFTTLPRGDGHADRARAVS